MQGVVEAVGTELRAEVVGQRHWLVVFPQGVWDDVTDLSLSSEVAAVYM